MIISIENINIIANITTALSTLGLVLVAWFALYTWRKEFIGQKKIELARQIMESVYDVQDAIIYARLDRSSTREIKEIEKWVNSEKLRDPQHMGVYPDRFHFWISHHRLAERRDKIEKFQNLANAASLYWDKEIFGLFYELSGYTLKIQTAAKDLYYNDTPQNPNDLMKIICFSDANDVITERINYIVEEFKLNLEPIYKDQRSKWKKLKKKASSARKK